jgi:hypothetical protein
VGRGVGVCVDLCVDVSVDCSVCGDVDVCVDGDGGAWTGMSVYMYWVTNVSCGGDECPYFYGAKLLTSSASMGIL